MFSRKLQSTRRLPDYGFHYRLEIWPRFFKRFVMAHNSSDWTWAQCWVNLGWLIVLLEKSCLALDMKPGETWQLWQNSCSLYFNLEYQGMICCKTICYKREETPHMLREWREIQHILLHYRFFLVSSNITSEVNNSVPETHNLDSTELNNAWKWSLVCSSSGQPFSIRFA